MNHSAISLPVAELKPALAGLSKIIGRKPSIPALECIRVFRDQDGWICLTATDLDTFASVRLEQPEKGPPAIALVPFSQLSAIAKGCGTNDTIIVEKQNAENVIVRYPIGNQTVERKLTGFSPKDCPPFPEFQGTPVVITDSLRHAILDALDCASTDETRPILNGAFIDVSQESGHYVVGTDGRHLFSSNSFQLALGDSVVIPHHRFLHWREFLNDGTWQLLVNKGETPGSGYIQINSRRWKFCHRLIDGNYPNWKQVVPDENQFETTVRFNPAAVEAALKLIPKIPCGDSSNKPIQLTIGAGKLALCGRSSPEEKPTELPIEGAIVKGKPLTISLSRTYLTRALEFGLNEVQFSDALSPVRFSNEGRQIIVMPIRPEVGPITPAPEPSRTPEHSEPTTERRSMSEHNPSSVPAPTEAKTAIDKATAQIETVKATVKLAASQLNELLESIKQVQREQKASDKEVQSVRATLEKLQSVRI